MSQLVRLEGKHSTQNAHCAVVVGWLVNACTKRWREGGQYWTQDGHLSKRKSAGRTTFIFVRYVCVGYRMYSFKNKSTLKFQTVEKLSRHWFEKRLKTSHPKNNFSKLENTCWILKKMRHQNLLKTLDLTTLQYLKYKIVQALMHIPTRPY